MSSNNFVLSSLARFPKVTLKRSVRSVGCVLMPPIKTNVHYFYTWKSPVVQEHVLESHIGVARHYSSVKN